ncbi:MAG TPA: alpha/beta fold hydrolase [Bryobacteraceae bacterium]|nr:alpha/beta fold hydrolase [Bryobacteraceae bacterium]
MRPFIVPGLFLLLAPIAFADDGQQVLSIDHYVPVHSTAPASAGQTTEIYVHELVSAGTALRGATLADRVALFVHGAGSPAEVAFDVDYQDYSWMDFLARAGFDVFGIDMTGYGRSTRPEPMNDPCNLAKDQQAALVPSLIPSLCDAPNPRPISTIASDWDDIDAVVNHIRALRHVDKLNLLGWSQGGPRAGGYAAHHPEKVLKLVLLAPAYNRAMPLNQAETKFTAASMNTQSRAEFIANWDRQVGCADQYDPVASDAIWSQMIESDPVGATWGTGIRRAPTVPTWGWNNSVVSKMQIPTLMVSGAHDKQVSPDRVRELYQDLGSSKKVFIDLACSSHNAMWEKNHLLLFRASLEWLTSTTVNGKPEGMQRLGY